MWREGETGNKASSNQVLYTHSQSLPPFHTILTLGRSKVKTKLIVQEEEIGNEARLEPQALIGLWDAFVLERKLVWFWCIYIASRGTLILNSHVAVLT